LHLLQKNPSQHSVSPLEVHYEYLNSKGKFKPLFIKFHFDIFMSCIFICVGFLSIKISLGVWGKLKIGLSVPFFY
jgi:hypothetical protein